MSSLVTAAQDALARLAAHLSTFLTRAGSLSAAHPYATGAALALAFLGFVPWAVGNFRQYATLARTGAVPNVFVGWAATTLIKPFTRETLSTAEYDSDANKERWLVEGRGEAEVPLRGRSRPKTGWHCVPHRQVEQFPDEKVKEMLRAEFRAIAAANPDIVQVGMSPHERLGHDALVLHPTVSSAHAVVDAALREVAHYHAQKDFSMHVVLAPQDCKLVIEQGWGERHPLSGRLLLPKEYTFLYAPLTADDMRVVGLIARAALGYMAASRNVH
ncbi:hypothetical protein M0805_006311 [Coniferiporia weirii]|nr:hypothetical protein M0805_006311 [Coniferiporia weirii]